MFEIVDVDGCFQLQLNTTYTTIFGAPVQEFLTSDVIAGINPLLKRNNEKTNHCPIDGEAKKVRLVNANIFWRLPIDHLHVCNLLLDLFVCSNVGFV